jgi:hypothetical protein
MAELGYRPIPYHFIQLSPARETRTIWRKSGERALFCDFHPLFGPAASSVSAKPAEAP